MGQRDDPEQLREELRQTRAEISKTIDALQERLNPDRLKNEAKTAIRGATIGKAEEAWEGAVERVEEMANRASYTARDSGDSIFDTIKSNPLPSALAGLGLGWLFMNRSGSKSRHPEYGSYSGRSYYGDRGGFNPAGARDKVEDVTERVSETASRVREDAGEFVGDMGGRAMDTGSSLMDSIKENPIPSALMGIGLGWFLMNRSSTEEGSYGPGARRSFRGYGTYEDYYPYGGRSRVEDVKSTIGDTAGKAGETVGDVAGKAGETVGDVASKAQETVGQVADTMQERAGFLAEEVQSRAGQLSRTTQYHAGRVEDRFQDMVRTNPMGMVAAAVAVGAAVGMALPSTQREDDMLGEARDNLVQQARSTTEETVQKVQRVAEEVRDTAKDEMKNEGIAK